MGSNLKIGYNNKFVKDKLLYNSSLDLYYNYRDKDIKPDTRTSPKNLDMLWQNDLTYLLFDNFSLNLRLEMFYDADIRQLDNDGNVLDKSKIGIVEAFFVKYSVIF